MLPGSGIKLWILLHCFWYESYYDLWVRSGISPCSSCVYAPQKCEVGWGFQHSEMGVPDTVSSPRRLLSSNAFWKMTQIMNRIFKSLQSHESFLVNSSILFFFFPFSFPRSRCCFPAVFSAVLYYYISPQLMARAVQVNRVCISCEERNEIPCCDLPAAHAGGLLSVWRRERNYAILIHNMPGSE